MSFEDKPVDTVVGPDDDAETTDHIPVPEYDVGQYVPQGERVSSQRRAILRREFGYTRAFYKSRPEKHFGLQRKLNQGRFGTTYDVYLTWSIRYALLASVVGILLGLGLAYLLMQFGVFEALGLPFTYTGSGPLADVILFVAENKALFGAAGLAVMIGAIATLGTWYGRYFYPYYVVDNRRRAIDLTLPHVIVYMYALSFGGMDLVEVFKRASDADNIYGEAANEFDMVVTDMEVFGNDIYTALRNARNLTPSDNMERFFDDLISVLDSGGDVTTFLQTESRKYMDEAVSDQESFLDTLETLSEVFVVAFVAAPVFLIVLLLMMAFLGSQTVPLLYLIIYAALPLGMLGYLVLISTLSEPYKSPDHEVEATTRAIPEPSMRLRASARFQIFQGLRFRDGLKQVLMNPTRVFRDQPLYTLAITAPLALVWMAFFWLRWDLTPAAFIDEAYIVTTTLVIAPGVLMAVPLSLFYELERRRKHRITQRLPDMLDILASSNQMGVSFVNGLGMVARNLSGSLAEQLRYTYNDIHWNGDVHRALLNLAARMRVPQLTRTSYILAEGSRSSGELHRLMSIAAEDTRQRYRLDRNRRQNLQAYTTVVVIGFLVYLGVIVILDYSFLGAIQEALEGTDTDDLGPITIDLDDIGVYRALFYHSAIIMAVGTGFISGKLTDNEILSGLKYSIMLILLTALVFLFL